MSKGAAEKTRFNFDDYDKLAQDPKYVYDILNKYLYNPEYIKVGHNFFGYDSMILNTWRRQMQLPEDYSFLDNAIDTDGLARAIKKQISPDRKNLSQWMFKMSSVIDKKMKTNLERLGKEYKIDYNYDTLHDGLNDVLLNRLIFLKQLWEIEI
jgi:DNA polymerase III epsilon subunit-like protein